MAMGRVPVQTGRSKPTDALFGFQLNLTDPALRCVSSLMVDSASLQRSYYQATAAQYDEMHGGDPAHNFALSFLTSTIDHIQARSVLDVGSGTGRVLAALKKARPQVQVTGVEPSKELRELGYSKGVPRSDLVEGDAHSLGYQDGSFDIVCAFGVMHHLAYPNNATREMLRVARRAIFISDHNDYGRGSAVTTALKQIARGAGLWNAYRFLITRGKGYRITDDDGLWYPYSIFDTHEVIRKYCSDVHFLNTLDSGPNLYRRASHVAMFGILRQSELSRFSSK
jgi:SAM-dependent methyltransferase